MAMSNSTRVGIFAIAALIGLGAIIVWKTDIFMVSGGYELRGSFQSIEGLTIGSEIRYRGLKVGKVLEIDPGPLEINLAAVIDKDIRFPADSELRVSYDGIVGQKFLEIKPGTGEALYKPGTIIYGVRTSGIVDFVDLGAQNLQETKKILQSIRMIIDSPVMRRQVHDITANIDKLAKELRETNEGIRAIVADPEFQKNVKGISRETNQTLSSANKFFGSVSKMNLRASGGVDVGSRSNSIIGNVDVVQDEDRYLRFGLGEGSAARRLGLVDILFTSRASEKWGFRLGVINNQLGGGLAFYPARNVTYRTDVYDLNNSSATGDRLNPRLRLSYEFAWQDYVDMTVKGDDVLNSGASNVTFGLQIRPSPDRIF